MLHPYVTWLSPHAQEVRPDDVAPGATGWAEGAEALPATSSSPPLSSSPPSPSPSPPLRRKVPQ